MKETKLDSQQFVTLAFYQLSGSGDLDSPNFVAQSTNGDH